jgi:hypothetical protein
VLDAKWKGFFEPTGRSGQYPSAQGKSARFQKWRPPLRDGHLSYWVCTPVVTAWPLSVRTVVEQLEKAASMIMAPNMERRMVRIV